MKAVLVFLILCVNSYTILGDMKGECYMAAFYLELGCTPIDLPELPDSSTQNMCPTAYTCPEFHPDPNKCYYRGKAYSDRAAIPQGEVLSLCSQACRCNVRGSPSIDCASVDCVESFDKDIKQQCVDTYEMDSCCSVGVVCGKDEISKLTQCEVENKIYYEGQRFDLKETAKSCLCGPGWDEENSTLCREVNCGLELHYQDDLMNVCAPVFYGNGICPIDFQCPSETTNIIRSLNIRNNEGECVFGNSTLRVGDEIQVDDKCTVCKCNVPPLASCQQSNDC